MTAASPVLEHISDLQLDLLIAGDLDPAACGVVDDHVGTCIACRQRLHALRADAAGFAEHAPPLAARSRAQTPVIRSRARRTRALSIAAAGLAAAATVVIAFRVGREPPPSGTRVKGGSFDVEVIVDRGGEQRMAAAGDPVAAGDRLQLRYTAASAGFLIVIGRDGSGATAVYFSSAAPAGVQRPVPIAIELDAVPGREELYVLFCERAVGVDAVRAAIERDPGSLAAPDSCVGRQLWLDKR